MNKVILVGRLTKDVEIRTSGENVFSRFSVAANRPFKNKDGEYDADFPNCVAFGKTAEFIEKYFRKGDMIGLTGRIQTGSYTNKDGVTVYTTEVAVETAEFVSSKKDSGDESASSASKSSSKKTSKKEESAFEENDDDDDFPFS